MTQQDLLNGFVKRAQQHGLDNLEIGELVKKANPDLMAILESLKGYAVQAGGMTKKHVVDPIAMIPGNASGAYEHNNKIKDILREWPEQRGGELTAAREHRDQHILGLGRGLGTAGLAGLGAYGAGKAMFGQSSPNPSQTMQPNMPQQLQQQ